MRSFFSPYYSSHLLTYENLTDDFVKVVEILIIETEGAAQTAIQYFENMRTFLVAVARMKLLTFEVSDLEKIKRWNMSYLLSAYGIHLHHTVNIQFFYSSLEPFVGVLHATKFVLAESFHGCRYVFAYAFTILRFDHENIMC
ncbi:hypothetical protein HanRHA438_Chr09g0410321 [Helianthus annuus]|nr:hypothetical protein HanRHA438_Chr09g0410321 [Helianthus annuus]